MLDCGTDVKMLCAFGCRYNPYYSSDGWISCGIACPRRAELSMPLPVHSKHLLWSSASILEKRYRDHLFGSSVEEQDSHIQPTISSLPRDKKQMVQSYKRDVLESTALIDDISENGHYFVGKQTHCMIDENGTFYDKFQPVEEPWLQESLQCGIHTARDSDLLINWSEEEDTSQVHLHDLQSIGLLSNHSKVAISHSGGPMSHLTDGKDSETKASSDRNHPVEEPWLLFPHCTHPEVDIQSTDDTITKTKSLEKQIATENREQGNIVSEGGGDQVSDHDSVLTEILINSSICTMQRIAVLEDGKLVEILLEPVKNNVLCDSVYIGTVTKLVPHMGGAFVNIGNSRPSLMDINHGREPFIFPPFGKRSKARSADASLLSKGMVSAQLEHESGDDNVEASDDEAVADVQSSVATYGHDNFVDQDVDDDLDSEETHMRSSRKSNNHQANYKEILDHVNENGSCIKDSSDPPLQPQVQEDDDSKGSTHSEQIWALVRKGTKIVVQVVKEGLGSKGPTLTAYPLLRSRFWVLKTRSNIIGISKKISGLERTRLRIIARSLRPPGFGLTARTVAAGHPMEELRKDLEGLLLTWRNIMESAKSAALAADEGVEGAVPAILHQALGQTLSVVQDYFSEKVKRMVVDSPRTYHEVTNYLQDIAPELCKRIELHAKKVPLFDEFNIEDEINNILNKRVPLPNGGSLVIEQTEALVSVDVNGGHGMFGQGTSQEKAVLDVNLAAAKQIARELRLRDIGGIIVVDFIDMQDDCNKRLVYEEVKKAVERDRSMIKVSELSKHGLMEITRKRVRPSVTFMISEPCTCCHGTGRVEALETSFSKIEHEVCRLLVEMDQKADLENPKSWPRLLLRVDDYMCEYLTAGKKTRLATLSSSLKVWILLKVARSFTRGEFEVRLLTDGKVTHDKGDQDGSSLAQPKEGSKPKESSSKASGGPRKRTKLFSVKKWKTKRKLI